jgi:RNA polymerase sigma factor (TIGR02999 family)
VGGNRVPGGDDSAEIVRLLDAWRTGDREAYDRLFSLVYSELHRLASGKLGRESQAHSLQPTLLVHEVYMRMADVGVPLTDRSHFLAIAARVMRQILVDIARQRRAQKRGGAEIRVELTEELTTLAQDPVDILSLHLAIERLQAHEPRSADVVELSYFGGLTNAEIGEMLRISPATVDRDLRHARAWLKRELTSTGARD